MPRRTRWTALAAAVAVLALAACSTGSTASTGLASPPPRPRPTDAFPVTIKHAFGETTITKPPQRACDGRPGSTPTPRWRWASCRSACRRTSGAATSKGSTPWKDEALGRPAPHRYRQAPAQYSEADGINFAEIAKTTPDVILAAYSGLTKAEYDKLSKIAPVVAYPRSPGARRGRSRRG